jgi:hypothetical protein
MLTQILPVPLNASATPMATPIPLPVPPPPAMNRDPSFTSQSLRSQPLNDPCTRTQSSRSGRDGFLRPPAFLQVLLDADDMSRVDLPGPRGPLGAPPLQIAVHCAVAQTGEHSQNMRPAPENSDICGHEPAVATRPAPDPVFLQADPNELGPLADDTLVAPAVPSRHPRQARRTDAGFQLWARQAQRRCP